jgi:hypothetical protein
MDAACMEYLRNVHKVLFGNTEEMSPLGKYRGMRKL